MKSITGTQTPLQLCTVMFLIADAFKQLFCDEARSEMPTGLLFSVISGV